MGRSVSTPSGARVVAYAYIAEDELDSDGFDMIVDGYQSELRAMFPSVEPADAWLDNEDHVVAENRLARFGMSEYCGLVAYWIVPKDEDQDYWGNPRPHCNFAASWIDSIADRFTKAFGTLVKTGTMSNGEGVYRRIGEEGSATNE